MDADVPTQLLDCGTDFRTLGALERRHAIGLVDQFRVKVQPVGRRVLKGRLLAAVNNAFVTLEACHVAETLSTVVTGLTRRNDTMFLSKDLETLWNRYSTSHTSRVATASRPSTTTCMYYTEYHHVPQCTSFTTRFDVFHSQ